MATKKKNSTKKYTKDINSKTSANAKETSKKEEVKEETKKVPKTTKKKTSTTKKETKIEDIKEIKTEDVKPKETKTRKTKKKTEELTPVEEKPKEVKKTTTRKKKTEVTETKVENNENKVTEEPVVKKTRKTSKKKDEVTEETEKIKEDKQTTKKRTTSKKKNTVEETKKNEEIKDEQPKETKTKKTSKKSSSKKKTEKPVVQEETPIVVKANLEELNDLKQLEEEKKSPPKKKKKTSKKKETKTNNSPTPVEEKKIIDSDTKILDVINDDELNTQLSLPLVTEKEIKPEEAEKKQVLKEYDIKKRQEKNLKTYIINICKVLLSFIESLKNFTKNKYNTHRQRREYKKLLKEKFRQEKLLIKEQQPRSKQSENHEEYQEFKSIKELKKAIQDKKERKKIKKEYANGTHDELVLLRYRDFKGFRKILVFFKNRIRVIVYDMKRFKKKFKYGTFKDKLLILLMLLMIAGFIAVIAFCGYIVVNAPEISEERLYKSNATVLYDKDGVEFARLGTENREKVGYEELPEVLIDAIVATEDSRFFQHNGVDFPRSINGTK